MDRSDLIQHLEQLDKKNLNNFKQQLEPRKLDELVFHDMHRNESAKSELTKEEYKKLFGNKKFYKTVHKSAEFVDNWIQEHAKDKIFLDYACGNGWNALKAAKAGADLSIGLDLSEVSVINARTEASKEHLEHNTFFLQGDCENTGLPNDCTDLCICSGMLHHLDLSHAFFELRRIMKKGGRILCVEALDYNPIIKIYREMTPSMRTEYEKDHILSYADIRFAKRFFKVTSVRHWHLCGILGVYFPKRANILDRLDDVLLRLPGIKMLSWMITFELIKE